MGVGVPDWVYDGLEGFQGYLDRGGPLEFVLTLALTFGGYHFLVFVHELGHALAVRARGLPVREFVVGDRADVVVRVAGMRMHFGRATDDAAVHGYVATDPNRASPADMLVIALAGPAADVLATVALLALASAGVYDGFVNVLIVLMAIAEACSAAGNLVPRERDGWLSDGRIAQLAREAMRTPAPVSVDPNEATSVAPPPKVDGACGTASSAAASSGSRSRG